MTEVECVTSFKFLGVHVPKDLSWYLNPGREGSPVPFLLRKLWKVHLSLQLLENFYRCSIKGILTNCITLWYGK